MANPMYDVVQQRRINGTLYRRQVRLPAVTQLIDGEEVVSTSTTPGDDKVYAWMGCDSVPPALLAETEKDYLDSGWERADG